MHTLELLLPQHSSSVESVASNQHIAQFKFTDGTTIFDHQTGSLNHVQVVVSPDSTTEHPATTELPLVRGLMAAMYKLAWTSFFSGEGIPQWAMRKRTPEDTEFADDVAEVSNFNIFVKEDHYADYINTTHYLARMGLLAKDILDGTDYEQIVIEA